jgi:hypothetical protein
MIYKSAMVTYVWEMHVFIIKTKVLSSQAYVTLTDFDYHV